MNKFIVKVNQENFDSLSFPNIECFALDASLSKSFLKSFKEKAKESIVLAYGEEAPLRCKELELDGIIADLSKEEKISVKIKELQKQIGDKVLGVVSRSRRHEAMLVSECEPDFVVFKAYKDGAEKIQELTSWYNEFFLIQSAISLEEENINFSDFIADIVIISEVEYKKFVAKLNKLD